MDIFLVALFLNNKAINNYKRASQYDMITIQNDIKTMNRELYIHKIVMYFRMINYITVNTLTISTTRQKDLNLDRNVSHICIYHTSGD